ncbi:MAG: chitinase, partial [Verrucomicrobiales bacterium VVV1]
NAAPTVALTSPSTGLSFSLGNNVLIGATASDADGTVASVQFFANGLSIGSVGAAPYSLSWKPTAAGTFALTAVATDNAGNSTTSTAVSVSVTAAAAPTVSISNPVTGATFGVGTSIPLNAVTTGGNGPISQVQFFVNGASLATDSAAPYNTTWTPTSAGTYNLIAVATDNAGVSGTST